MLPGEPISPRSIGVEKSDISKPSIPTDTVLRPFPHAALRQVLSLRGNEKCCDCPSVDVSWASVNHGILLCLECAGKHRSLGVQNSFVRSIHMDTWSHDQVEMMLQGGNSQLHEYFKMLKIESSNLSVERLYQTRASAHYREKLREKVYFLALDNSLSDMSANNLFTGSACGSDSCSLGRASKVVSGTFTDGPLGMTLAPCDHGRAYVSSVFENGCAEKFGIEEMDVVISVAGRSMTNYDEIMDSIPFANRPMRIEFYRSGLQNSSEDRVDLHGPDLMLTRHTECRRQLLCTTSQTVCSSNVDIVDGNIEDSYVTATSTSVTSLVDPVESFDRTDQLKVSFASLPLGLTLSMNDLGCAEVTKINPGGYADRLGVKAGDMVVNIGSRKISNYDEAMKSIRSSFFPLEIVFERMLVASSAGV